MRRRFGIHGLTAVFGWMTTQPGDDDEAARGRARGRARGPRSAPPAVAHCAAKAAALALRLNLATATGDKKPRLISLP
jgi:hypothetical protein